ncbi:hypothetical protein [Microbacterium foliorum]|uniref:hypothetical protein n=1 Tax=Microbacterium foliorum TaxID=104336 RepID=UPI00099F90F5|nr:hypothetical protein [Microbacterium foliorum]AQY02069.1 hypothetical protein B2G67_11745 [Microbacterium foliorum]
MSVLIVNGQTIGGSAVANMYLFQAIAAIQEAGDIRQLTFSGSHGQTILLVNAATQAQLVLDESADSLIVQLPSNNSVDVLKDYGVLDADGKAIKNAAE